MARKVFIGPALRALRESNSLTQAAFAQRLGLSVSYLNQIENNQRPVTASVLLALGQTFGVDLALFAQDDSERLVADLRETMADPLFAEGSPSFQEIKRIAADAPQFARAFLRVYQAHKRLSERMSSGGSTALVNGGEMPESAVLPYEEVRDYFHYTDNYVDELDRTAEDLSMHLNLIDEADKVQVLVRYLAQRHGVRVELGGQFADQILGHYNAATKVMMLNASLDGPTRAFQLATRIARLEQEDAIGMAVLKGGFRSEAAQDICRVALANHYAAALVMPYRALHAYARESRHDIDRIAMRFGTSFEQVTQRLSSLQRPGLKGIPFFFMKVDHAGNVIKRHSATRFQFPRFGGTCPLWNTYDAFSTEGRTLVQVSEMPDGTRYLMMARAVTRFGSSWRGPLQRYALGFGCDSSYADGVVYADGLDVKHEASAVKVGLSCRICERDSCIRRAVPPINRDIRVPQHARAVVPFELR